MNHYSNEYFEDMAQHARETEQRRVETGVAVGSLDMNFAVATWLTDREVILAAIGTVLDKMLAVDGRSTGIFEVTLELPYKT